MKAILVSGANGFVGRRLCASLASPDVRVLAAVRRPSETPPWESEHVETRGCPDLRDDASWRHLLDRVDAVVHLACQDDSAGSKAAADFDFRRVNVDGTLRLADDCRAAGVKRFVYLSSIKAVGEGGRATYDEQSKPDPQSSYGASKLEAESRLREFGVERGLEVAILRPPLVYGPDVRGSFLKLLQLIHRGAPLPFGGGRSNPRGMIHLDNLVAAIVKCLSHPAAVNEVFHLADGEALSTAELIECLAAHLKTKSRLFPVPRLVLRLGGRVIGRFRDIERLVRPLFVSSEKIRRQLGWRPEVDLNAGLKATAEWFLNRGEVQAASRSPDHQARSRAA